ncbi:MAG: SDR family NAD(P)-dependent oxidoreductase [Planctomycetota bacterium]|jgi:NAD(P)-dependent dehydrogenase (short-subunit alcohol dehydrogenase family)
MSALSFDLNGTVALVTGGTSGIGLGIARALIAQGAKIVVGSRGAEKVAAAQGSLSALAADPADVIATPIDVTDKTTVDAAIARAVEAFGRIDVLVNCAGGNLKKPSLDIEEDEHKWLFDVNYFGPFYACQAFARQCAKQGMPNPEGAGYSIVNVCSVTSFMALSEVTTYAATKGALLSLTRQLAVEWPRLYGIRVNGIAPGFVPADQNRQILKSGDRGRRILENTPMERFGTPDEIASSVVYLISQAGRFVNGECVKIDGGFMINGVSDAQPNDPGE